MITTDRLVLRRWTPDDSDVFISLADDPSIAKWTGRSIPSSELFNYYLNLDTSFAVQSDRKVIGNISFFKNSTTSALNRLNVYEAAFYLLPEYQGFGYASEAFGAACNYMFNRVLADAVIVGILKDNIKAKEFIIRAGGQFCFERETDNRETEDFYVLI